MQDGGNSAGDEGIDGDGLAVNRGLDGGSHGTSVG